MDADRTDLLRLDRSGPWLVLAGGLILSFGTLIHPVEGHSFYLNINWHAGFLAELRAGEWHPRWLSTMNQGLGAPSFYFYAPLPFYISAALDVLWPVDHGPNFGPVATSVLAVIASGLAMFSLIRALYGARIALPAAAAFMAMPYHFGVDLWWRAAFGELWAFVWLPLLALGIVRQARGQTGGVPLTGAAAAAMILSHLPSFVIGLCGLAVMAVCCLPHAWARRGDRAAIIRILGRTTGAIATAVASTAAYWYPALTTTHLTAMNEYMTQGWYAYSNNFIFWNVVNPENLGIQTLAAAILIAGLSFAYVIVRKKGPRSIPFQVAAAVFAMSLFMTTPTSAIIYDLLPPLQRLQFPWRFLLLSEIALAVLLAQTLASLGLDRTDQLPKKSGLKAIGCTALALLGLGLAMPGWMRPTYTAADTARVAAYLNSRADGDEYRTRGTDQTYYSAITFGQLAAPAAPRFVGESTDARLSGTRADPGLLVFNRYWYPNLVVRDRMTGEHVDTAPQPSTGLAMAQVPAGPYDLVVEKRRMPEETIGYGLSAAGLLFALLWSAISRGRRNRLAAA